MANAEHLEILKKGVKAWNEWQRTSGIIPDLRHADLRGANLRSINLAGTRLECADLSTSSLEDANLGGARLCDADLSGAHLERANLDGANLDGANLRGANLEGAYLRNADLRGATMEFAKLSGAMLINAELRNAHLAHADLSDASLNSAQLSGVNLCDADLTEAFLGSTALTDMDLSEVKGLYSTRHLRPSNIGIETLYKSQGRIPDEFLRGAGVPEDVIEHLLPLIRHGPPIQWYSCFISYSTKDDEFAKRLHARMRKANMRVWFAPEDLKGGRKLHEQLFDAIQLNDRLLLVLSDHSILSEWVMTEIRKAREAERKENRRKLFPIRLVDFNTLREWTCFDADSGKDLAVEVREYFIPDFSNWKDHDAFEEAFKRLQKDLKAVNSGRP